MNYEKIYNQIINRAKSRILDGYKERHHIIPRCMEGKDDEDNLVDLTAREHFLCHLLLCEIYPNENKLKFAAWAMANQMSNGREYKIGARVYENLKKEFAKEWSKKHKGFRHSEKTKLQLSKSHLGKVLNEETKQKLRKPKPKDFGNKISKYQKGRPKSDEHKKAISLSKKGCDAWNKGIKAKPESVLKMREAQPRRREINQLDLEGKFIKKWFSISEATREYGCGVSHCLAGYQAQTKGYKWEYSNGKPAGKRIGGKKKKLKYGKIKNKKI